MTLLSLLGQLDIPATLLKLNWTAVLKLSSVKSSEKFNTWRGGRPPIGKDNGLCSSII